jgi:hypothetical protein
METAAAQKETACTTEEEEEGRSKFHGNPGSFGASIGSIAYLQQITRLESKGKKEKKGKRAITVYTQQRER